MKLKFKKEPEKIKLVDKYQKVIGTINYKEKDGFLVVNHTFINEDYRNQGYAKMLVDELVSDVRKRGYKIYPRCGYVADILGSDDSYQDIIYELK